jgi:hypothetical protein
MQCRTLLPFILKILQLGEGGNNLFGAAHPPDARENTLYGVGMALGA